MNISSIPSDFVPDYSEALFSSATKSKSIVTDDKTIAEAIIFQKLGTNVSMVPFEKRWYHKLFYDDDFSKFWQHQRSDGSLLIVDLNNQKIIYNTRICFSLHCFHHHPHQVTKDFIYRRLSVGPQNHALGVWG